MFTICFELYFRRMHNKKVLLNKDIVYLMDIIIISYNLYNKRIVTIIAENSIEKVLLLITNYPLKPDTRSYSDALS